MNSMERRLQIGLAVVLLALMGMLWITVNRSIHTLVEDFVVARLVDDAEHMLAALEPSPARTRVRWRRVNNIYNKVNSGHYYVFSFEDGRSIASPSLWDKTLELPEVASGDAVVVNATGPVGERLLVWAKKFTKQNQVFTLAVAEDLAPIKAHRQRFKQRLALLMIAGSVFLLVLQTWLVRRSFRRFDLIEDDIRKVERGRQDRLTEDVPDEVKPLVTSFNHLLDLLVQRLSRSRNSLGNLAHALKGPLNLLMQNLSRDDKASQQQVERIQQLVERELKRARLAGKGVTTQKFVAPDELPDLIEVLKQVHRKNELEIACLGAGQVPAFGDREDMLELIGNVLDNACKWARSKVRCRFSVDEAYRIAIEDDGKGLNDDQLGNLARRGVRLDESVEGTGLGLAIAKDIVSLYGGSLRFDRSAELGGLRVRISLPLDTAK